MKAYGLSHKPRGDLELSIQDARHASPVLVLPRQEVIGLLRTVMVAPITSTIYGAPSEVVVGPDEGLKRASAINLDHVQTVERARLIAYIGSVPPATMKAVCRALSRRNWLRRLSAGPERSNRSDRSEP